MTEKEWLTCDDPRPMLDCLFARRNKRGRHVSRRRQQLLGCAHLRGHWPLFCHDFSRAAVAVAEQLADGLQSDKEAAAALAAAERVVKAVITQQRPQQFEMARRAVDVLELRANWFEWFFLPAWYGGPAAGPLVRDVFGNVFSPQLFDPDWRAGDVRGLALAAYEERSLPSGHLDLARLAVLSDALEEAGCTDADILSHLRSPGPHVRGCWALDLILAKG